MKMWEEKRKIKWKREEEIVWKTQKKERKNEGEKLSRKQWSFVRISEWHFRVGLFSCSREPRKIIAIVKEWEKES